jgi:hypothetical protein
MTNCRAFFLHCLNYQGPFVHIDMTKPHSTNWTSGGALKGEEYIAKKGQQKWEYTYHLEMERSGVLSMPLPVSKIVSLPAVLSMSTLHTNQTNHRNISSPQHPFIHVHQTKICCSPWTDFCYCYDWEKWNSHQIRRDLSGPNSHTAWSELSCHQTIPYKAHKHNTANSSQTFWQQNWWPHQNWKECFFDYVSRKCETLYTSSSARAEKKV